MIITISPIAGLPGQPETTLTVTGDVITIDGAPCDLSAVPEGGETEPEDSCPFVGAITRRDGEIHCAIRCLYDPATAEPNQPIDPAHWVVAAAGGPVDLPVVRRQEG